MSDVGVDEAISARAVVGFARLLRAAGLAVSADSTVLFADALSVVGGSQAEQVYWAARATLCRRPEAIERFDACFAAWFSTAFTQNTPLGELPDSFMPEVVIAFDDPTDPGTDGPRHDEDAGDVPTLAVRFSQAETLRQRDFATYTTVEHVAARRAVAELRVVAVRRRSRRLVGSKARGRPDVRRTMRAAMRTDGEPLRRAYRALSTRPRRLVLLCDVSGSMEPYARVIIQFLHSAVVARRHVEAFALGTRLTRLTRELMNRDPDAAIASAAQRVTDWSGGTRLGETLRTFNDEWGVRGMARGAVVVVISDGWDRGEPALLAEQMQRLARVAHRVVWVNPLKASPGFAPLAAGMAAALPYVDEFVEGHSLASLIDLVKILEGQDA